MMDLYFGSYCDDDDDDGDDDDDVLFGQLSFPLIQPSKYDCLKAKMISHSSIKAPRPWSQYLCQK